MSNPKVIPTAWMVAYCRTFTDIPFAKETFEELEKNRIANNQEVPEFQEAEKMSPQFEARYKLTTRLIRESGIKQILEIAVGLTPRGMVMTEDPEITYVETDFAELIDEKKSMISRFLQTAADTDVSNIRPHLFFETANALNLPDLEKACEHFDPSKPIIIVCEGLLRYLTFPEKEIVANNIKTLLKKFGGLWITPDISKKRALQHSDVVGHAWRDKVNEMVGMNIDANFFDSEEHAKEFFGNLGFEIESHSFVEEIDSLVSPAHFGVPREKLEDILKRAQVFVMKTK